VEVVVVGVACGGADAVSGFFAGANPVAFAVAVGV
jgi:hypothetical protein